MPSEEPLNEAQKHIRDLEETQSVAFEDLVNQRATESLAEARHVASGQGLLLKLGFGVHILVDSSTKFYAWIGRLHERFEEAQSEAHRWKAQVLEEQKTQRDILHFKNEAERELDWYKEAMRKCRDAMIQAHGALRLDAMVDDAGTAYGTTVVALDAIVEALDHVRLLEGPHRACNRCDGTGRKLGAELQAQTEPCEGCGGRGVV